MFYNCTKLNYIKVNFTNWSKYDQTARPTLNWVKNVSPTGTFKYPSQLSKRYGESYIPENWDVVTF